MSRFLSFGSNEKLKKLARGAQGNARAGTPAEAAKDADALLLSLVQCVGDADTHGRDDDRKIQGVTSVKVTFPVLSGPLLCHKVTPPPLLAT